MPYKIEDLAYIAGVLDSDGYIGMTYTIEKRHRTPPTKSYSAIVKVTQCKPQAINLIKDMFGGHIYIMTKGINQRDQTTVAIARREEVKELLTAVFPYLRIKSEQAKLVLEYIRIREAKRQKTKIGSKGRLCFPVFRGRQGTEEETLWLNVKSLNQTGRRYDYAVSSA